MMEYKQKAEMQNPENFNQSEEKQMKKKKRKMNWNRKPPELEKLEGWRRETNQQRFGDLEQRRRWEDCQ